MTDARRFPEDEIPPPDWVAGDLEGSLERFGAWLTGQARRQFMASGTHVELYFIVQADGQMALAPAPPGMERATLMQCVRDTVQTREAAGVIHVAEAWTYLPETPDAKSETLLVRLESRAGTHLVWFNPILRGSGPVALADPIELRNPPRTRFTSFFGKGSSGEAIDTAPRRRL
jgi:hypothetical protein